MGKKMIVQRPRVKCGGCGGSGWKPGHYLTKAHKACSGTGWV